MFTTHVTPARAWSRWGAVAALIAASATCSSTAPAADFVEPPVFASTNGVLDIMMIAKAKPIQEIAFTPPGGGGVIHPTGWVYEVCRRPASGLTCPPGPGTVSPYGGVRLALRAGDVLKVRFVNRLPAVNPNKLNHVTDPGQANLFRNPSNIHTHGLLTPARAATVSDPTFGDYVFVAVFNSANGVPVPQTSHQHGAIVMDSVDYKIPIPPNHPSGLMWFHPHIHGSALNQVVQGLSGLITVGSVGDNVTGDAANVRFPDANVRHMLLKEIQVLAAGTVDFDSGPQTVANGEVLSQEDPGFCVPTAAPNERRQGSCPGQDNTPDGSSPSAASNSRPSRSRRPTARSGGLEPVRAASATICSWSTTPTVSRWWCSSWQSTALPSIFPRTRR